MADRAQAASQPAEASAQPPVRAGSRVERSRRIVLQATFELLYESGVAGFSVDEVARRSGVAKTTIYRHWPTREALVIDACSRIGDQQIIPDTGSCEQDLTAILTNIAAQLETANWSAVLPSIVDLAEHQPEFADVHRRIQHGHAAPLKAALKRGIDSGAIPADTNIAAAVAAMLGSMFYQRWFVREPIEDAFIAAIVESVTRARPIG
jgi:AcrR family transcriptional regulator